MLIGIIGAPSSGKSTFFKAATLAEVEISSRPFTTIKPNHAIGYVRVNCPAENDFNKKCNPREGYCIEGQRFVPIELLDVAGLVPGAHEGKGLGNQFLSDLSTADVLLHIVDASGSTNEEGQEVPEGSHNVLKNIEFLEEEINLWFFSIIKKVWDTLSKKIAVEKKEATKEIANQFSGLKITELQVEESIKESNLNPENIREWSEQNLKDLCRILRKKSKPIIIVANKIDKPSSEDNLKKIKDAYPKDLVIPTSADTELALKSAAKADLINYIPGDNNFKVNDEKSLSNEQKKALEKFKTILKKYDGSGVQKALNGAVFKFLNYIAIFPGGSNKLEDSKGNVMPDCFLLPQNSTALDFAYKLHSDIGNNFIKAVDVKSKRTIGKDHVLKNEDVIEIITRG